jgi:hypothetical protein
MIQLQSNPDGPDLLQLQWRLRAEQLALFHGRARPSVLGAVFVMAYINGSSAEEKELHVDPGRGALVDPLLPVML